MCKRVIIEDRRSRTSDASILRRHILDCGGNVDAGNLEHIGTFIQNLINGGWSGDRIKDAIDVVTRTLDPLTSKGQEILAALQKEYGTKKGEQVLYAGQNAGRFKGIDVGGTSTVASIDKTRDTVIRAGKRTVVIHHDSSPSSSGRDAQGSRIFAEAYELRDGGFRGVATDMTTKEQKRGEIRGSLAEARNDAKGFANQLLAGRPSRAGSYPSSKNTWKTNYWFGDPFSKA